MTEQEKLLNKYYNGNTSLKEERELSEFVSKSEDYTPEQDIFGYYKSEGTIPDDLEEVLLEKLEIVAKKKRKIQRQIFSYASAAAVVIIFLSIYLDFRNTKNMKMENDFFVMEQALFQISESIQPDVQKEMLVLWVDEDVEIIIN